MTTRHPTDSTARTHTLLKLLAAAGVCTSILALHPAQLLAQPSTFSITMPPSMGGMDRIEFDEEGGPGEDFDPSMMMRRGGGNADDRIEFKTDLGKRIQRLDFSRNPQSIVAARAKLASQAREKRLRPPEEPKLEEPKPDETKPEASKPADITTPAAPAPAPSPGTTPPTSTPTPPTLPAIPSLTPPTNTPTDPSALEGPTDMPPGIDGMSPGRVSNPRAISPAQRKAREAAQKALADKAENFRLLVVAGDWKSVGEFIEKEGGEDKKSIYAHVLTTLVSADQAMVPDEVLELSEASPDALNEKLITSLGQILSNTSQRGSQASAVAPQIKAGTLHFGGSDPVKRKNAATLLVAAGLPIEAQEYLPALEVAREQKDPELLNLYAVYFDALAKSKQGTPREEAIAQGWRTTMEVLSLEKSKPEQREKALALALIFINDIPQDEGDAFLKRLFASEPDMGWKAIDSVSNRSRQLRQRNAKADERVKALLSARRVGLAMLTGSGESLGSWRTGLNLLTGLFVEEAELSRRVSSRGAPAEGMDDPSYAGRYNNYNNDGANRQQIIPADQLGETLPTPAWLRSIDQGLAAKLELMVASTAAASGDTAAVLSMIKPVVKTDRERALKLANALVSAWPAYARRTPGDSSGGANPYNRSRYYNPYAMYGGYGGYGYDTGGGGVPLTRAKQQRVIAQLKDVLSELRAIDLKGVNPAALVGAFAASHSDAEVYQPEDIQAVFGDPSAMEPEVRSLLVANMRQRLASTWRQPRIQQAAGSKRTDKELTAMVLRGYDVAVALATISIQSKPDSFEAHAALGDLFFDKAEFLYGQKADMPVYTATRAQAFSAYDRASELYSGALKTGATKPSARVFMQWFNSALGASELGQLTRQDNADQQQVSAVAAAIDALGPDQAAKHRALFAQEAQTASRSLPPELKVRFLRLASQIIGSAPEGKDARAMLDYYDDLTKEIQLSLTVDGSTNTPAGQPFGAQLAIWCTRAISRESGSFARYLTSDGYNPMTGQPINYKEDIEKHLRERLSDRFEILSVTFHKPTVQPISIARPGWEQFPLAYLLLKPKDVSVDRLPQVKIDMDFSDGQGSVIIPITSTEVLLDARTTAGAQPPARPVGDLQLEMILDDRVIPPTLQPTQPTATGQPLPVSPIRLEIRAKGKGLIPDLNRVIDTASLTGVKLDRVEDKGLNIVELDAAGTEVVPIAERSWMLHLSPTSAGVIDFAFPKAAALAAGQPAPKITLKQFSDADIVDAKPIVSVGSPVSLISRLWPALVAIASAAIAAAVLIFLIRRNPKAAATKAPPVSVPSNLTPFTAVATLRKIQSLNGTALPPPAQEELAIAIRTLERRYFGPAAPAEAQDIELRPIVQTWVDRVAK
ncbi:MAG: hypothetical protein IBJ18_00010 [Phycisphaerales bacterium]|nr:hypothetical protein [Phycisphaerales bacterium]